MLRLEGRLKADRHAKCRRGPKLKPFFACSFTDSSEHAESPSLTNKSRWLAGSIASADGFARRWFALLRVRYLSLVAPLVTGRARIRWEKDNGQRVRARMVDRLRACGKNIEGWVGRGSWELEAGRWKVRCGSCGSREREVSAETARRGPLCVITARTTKEKNSVECHRRGGY